MSRVLMTSLTQSPTNGGREKFNGEASISAGRTYDPWTRRTPTGGGGEQLPVSVIAVWSCSRRHDRSPS